MKPRIVWEPITGLSWVAARRADYWLSWLPTISVIAAFGLGWFIGSRA